MRTENRFFTQMSKFWSCQSGATAIEYALIMALIFLVIIVAVTNFATNATNKMKAVEKAIAG